MGKKAVAALLAWMFVVSLAGCGAKADVTDQEVSERSSAVESEADDSVTDESTGSEEAGGEESTSNAIGAENESIVLYAEIEKYGEYGPQKDNEFESVNNVLEAPEDVPVFYGDGIEVGYIKSGSTISITESGLNWWARFENPIDGTDYDYLYVMKDYVADPNIETYDDWCKFYLDNDCRYARLSDIEANAITIEERDAMIEEANR